MSEMVLTPSEEAIDEAKRHPNGWVYQINPRCDCKRAVPPQAIVGAWKVDEHGNIVGAFIPNPNYKPDAEGSEGASHPS